MSTLRRALWLFTILGAIAAMYIMVATFRRAETAQEQANCATVAIALALIPYCLARAVAESNKKD